MGNCCCCFRRFPARRLERRWRRNRKRREWRTMRVLRFRPWISLFGFVRVSDLSMDLISISTGPCPGWEAIGPCQLMALAVPNHLEREADPDSRRLSSLEISWMKARRTFRGLMRYRPGLAELPFSVSSRPPPARRLLFMRTRLRVPNPSRVSWWRPVQRPTASLNWMALAAPAGGKTQKRGRGETGFA